MRAFWGVAARKSAGAGPSLHCPIRGVSENGCVAEAGDASSTAFANQDVCLKHEVMVNCVASVWNEGKAYSLEVSVNDVHAVHVPQAFSDRHKLSSRSIRTLTERSRGAWG